MIYMIKVYPASTRFSADHGWLKSNFSFSFAGYYDPDNVQFGPMRVLNDDWISPAEGFGMHPHREMEIVTLMLKGELEHQDSLGNKAVTTWGGVQRMSAGTGIYHSEMNPSSTEPSELLQMWFLPGESGLQPSYETTAFQEEAMKGQLLPIAAHDAERYEKGTVAKIHQDMTIYLSELEAGSSITFEQPEGRRAFVFVLEGSMDVNGNQLARRDAARLTDEQRITLIGGEGVGAKLMLIDLP